MTALISFPFRIDPSGAVATRDDSTEDYMAEELSQMIQTHPGERVLVPTYGINDPAYSGMDAGMLTAQVSIFGPPVRVTSVQSQMVSDAETDVVVSFTAAGVR